MEYNIDDLIKPVFVEERKEVHIPYEFLIKSTVDDCKKLANKINSSNVTKLIFNCLYSSNKNKYYDFQILDYIAKEKIEVLSFDNYATQEQLNGFEHVYFLALHLDRANKINLSSFVNINQITLTGFSGDNVIFPKKKSISIYFYEEGAKTFNYKIDIEELESISFTGFKRIDLSDVLTSIKRMYFYKVKELRFCKQLKSIESLRFEKCNFTQLDTGAIYDMSSLKTITLDKCKYTGELADLNQNINIEIL